MQKLLPNKNHKAFLKELCALIKDYEKISDFRNTDEVHTMLKKRLPLLYNNFDKSDATFDAVSMLLFDIFQDLGTVMKFIKNQ